MPVSGDRMQLITGIPVLMFCVGLPISFIIGKDYKKTTASEFLNPKLSLPYVVTQSK